MSDREPLWAVPPATLRLAGDEIHVWRCRLDLPSGCVRRLFETLSADERARAAQLFFAQDRRRFVAGRGLLRALLGGYLGSEPGRLQFTYEQHGKPALLGQAGQGQLAFNLAHSGELALYAFARSRAVGIDLERVRPLADLARAAAQICSARELAVFRALPASAQLEAFFGYWAAKEAVVKAYGHGLASQLAQVEIARPAWLLGSAGAACSLLELPPIAGYAAALAAQGQGRQLTCWQVCEEMQAGALSLGTPAGSTYDRSENSEPRG